MFLNDRDLETSQKRQDKLRDKTSDSAEQGAGERFFKKIQRFPERCRRRGFDSYFPKRTGYQNENRFNRQIEPADPGGQDNEIGFGRQGGVVGLYLTVVLN